MPLRLMFSVDRNPPGCCPPIATSWARSIHLPMQRISFKTHFWDEPKVPESSLLDYLHDIFPDIRFLHYEYTLCPNKSDPVADFLIACNKVYRIKHNFMNTYPYVSQTIMQSFWMICVSVTQKSNCKQNCINVWLYNYSITTCLQSYNDNV